MQLPLALFAAFLPLTLAADIACLRRKEWSTRAFPTQTQHGSALTFDPTSVKAAEGDTIVFSFYPKNHSVTQSSFESPCETLSDNPADSGFYLSAAGDPPIQWNWTVPSVDPTWFYCAQTLPANHCKAGMVFAVNPPADKSIGAFIAKGGSGTTSTSTSTSTPAGSSTASGTRTSTSSTPSGSSTAGAGGKNGAMNLATSACRRSSLLQQAELVIARVFFSINIFGVGGGVSGFLNLMLGMSAGSHDLRSWSILSQL
ncbi:hypothetical protein DFP72DRAFT_873608 [Ephemerocybe angulata]|uniref:Uncharacterized protein n=1 Tax=Ephemerocybe angulata TaxID=980116 RepID=A0A8H6IG70_9AGAR|nr:hypothetical protein DFP72DRAFT_873608 [Tulosesus angulatus]